MAGRRPHRRSLDRLLTAAGVALLALALVLPAGAATPGELRQARLDLTIRFLQDVQNLDGGFGGARGAPSDPLFSAWVAIALAAGGVNPQDQRRPGGVDVYGYLTAHADALASTTDLDRAALVSVAAGTSPRDFGGVDLVARILERQLPSGALPFTAEGRTGYVNATAFAILPLSTLRDPAVEAAVRRGVDWLLSVQEASGAWGFAPGREPSSDVTAAVIQALHAAGRGGTPEEAQAWTYLHALQGADGGFGFSKALPASNAASTAWVVQAMWAAGMDPAGFAPERPSPLDHLASLQRPDGSIAWQAGEDLNAVWMTAYAAPAYAGRPLPVPAVARAASPSVAEPPPVPAPAPTAATERARIEGEGGFGRTRGGAVVAGGGGRGAPLFSRPQPQSQGTAAGGAHDTSPRTPRSPAPHPPEPDARPASGDRSRASAGSDPEVTGVVLGDAQAPAAAGLQGARAGGDQPGPALALALTGALLLCAALGMQLERRRPEALA